MAPEPRVARCTLSSTSCSLSESAASEPLRRSSCGEHASWPNWRPSVEQLCSSLLQTCGWLVFGVGPRAGAPVTSCLGPAVRVTLFLWSCVVRWGLVAAVTWFSVSFERHLVLSLEKCFCRVPNSFGDFWAGGERLCPASFQGHQYRVGARLEPWSCGEDPEPAALVGGLLLSHMCPRSAGRAAVTSVSCVSRSSAPSPRACAGASGSWRSGQGGVPPGPVRHPRERGPRPGPGMRAFRPLLTGLPGVCARLPRRWAGAMRVPSPGELCGGRFSGWGVMGQEPPASTWGSDPCPAGGVRMRPSAC